MQTTGEIGSAWERWVCQQLEARGYGAALHRVNNPTVDIRVTTRTTSFDISVKAGTGVEQIRLGWPESIARLGDQDFVFAILPVAKGAQLSFSPGGQRLWIIPGVIARTEGPQPHFDYLSKPGRNGQPRKASFNVVLKKRGTSPLHADIWARWEAEYQDAWHLLPK